MKYGIFSGIEIVDRLPNLCRLQPQLQPLLFLQKVLKSWMDVLEVILLNGLTGLGLNSAVTRILMDIDTDITIQKLSPSFGLCCRRWDGKLRRSLEGLWILKPPIDGLGGAPLAGVENSFMSSKPQEETLKAVRT